MHARGNAKLRFVYGKWTVAVAMIAAYCIAWLDAAACLVWMFPRTPQLRNCQVDALHRQPGSPYEVAGQAESWPNTCPTHHWVDLTTIVTS